MKKLSERLIRAAYTYIEHPELVDVLEEAAELARRVEAAPTTSVDGMPGTANGFGLMVTSASLVGKRVAILLVEGEEQ